MPFILSLLYDYKLGVSFIFKKKCLFLTHNQYSYILRKYLRCSVGTIYELCTPVLTIKDNVYEKAKRRDCYS